LSRNSDEVFEFKLACSAERSDTKACVLGTWDYPKSTQITTPQTQAVLNVSICNFVYSFSLKLQSSEQNECVKHNDTPRRIWKDVVKGNENLKIERNVIWFAINGEEIYRQCCKFLNHETV